jgi:hypothetical protein
VEQPLPHVVAEQGHVGPAGPVFLRQEVAAEERLQAEDREHVVRDSSAFHALGADVRRGEAPADIGGESHALKGRVALLPRGVIGVGDADAHQVPLGRGLVDVDEAVGLGEGKRAQEEAVEDAEDRRVAGDPDREHEDDGRAEGRLAAHHAGGNFQVVPDAREQAGASSAADGERLGTGTGRDRERLQLGGRRSFGLRLRHPRGQ